MIETIKTPAQVNAESYLGVEISPELWEDFEKGRTVIKEKVGRAAFPQED